MAETEQEMDKIDTELGPRQRCTIATTESPDPSLTLIALEETKESSEISQPCNNTNEGQNCVSVMVDAAEDKSTEETIRHAKKEGSTTPYEGDGNDQVTADDPPNQPLQLIEKQDFSGPLQQVDKASKENEDGLSKRKPVQTKSVLSLEDDAKDASSCKLSKNDKQKEKNEQIAKNIPSVVKDPVRPVGNGNTVGKQKSQVEETDPDDPTDFNDFRSADQGLPATLDSRLGEHIAQYVRPSDQTIDDVRQRLKTALNQTYALRKAFTERVYGKYRVCLHPPNTPAESEARIKKDPAAAYEQLCCEINKYQDEKELEKKLANKINSEVAAVQQAQQASSNDVDTSPGIMAAARMFAQGNVDHGDQLMFVSAGLNLIILPEEEVPAATLKLYSERCPLHPVTGQRVKNISLAAATAGDVMLERKRKSILLRMERQDQYPSLYSDPPPLALKKFENLTKATSVDADDTPSTKLATLSPTNNVNNFNETQPSKSKTREATTNIKASKSRGSSGLSYGQLLSLSPMAEEFVRAPQEIKSFAPSTMALMARGSRFGVNKSAQQRLKHPHPDSLGGRRRASVDAPYGSIDPMHSEPFPSEYLALTLPPLPGTNERQERKPLPVCTTANASTHRGVSSIQKILDNFVVGGDGEQTCDVTKIKLLYGLPRLVNKQKSESVVSASTVASKEADGNVAHGSSSDSRPLDPILTFSVLHAVGLLGRAPTTSSSKVVNLLPTIDEKNSALWSQKLKSLHGTVLNADKSLTSAIFAVDRKRPLETAQVDLSEKKPKYDPDIVVPVQSIRGGGGASKEKTAEKMQEASRKSQLKVKSSSSRKMSEDSASSVKSAPVMSSSIHIANVATPAQSVHLFNMQLMNQMGSYTQFQMANAMHQLHHPAAGDLANLHSFQQQQQHAVAQFIGAAGNPIHPFPPFGRIGGIVAGYGPVASSIVAGSRTDIRAPISNGRGKASAAIARKQVPDAEQKPSVPDSGLSTPHDKKVASGAHLNAPSSVAQIGEAKENVVESKTACTDLGKTGKLKPIEPIRTVEKESETCSMDNRKAKTKSESSIFNLPDQPRETGSVSEEGKQEQKSTKGKNFSADRMKYVAPSATKLVGSQEATLIRSGYIHSILDKIKDLGRLNACLEHLYQAGAAVPIPKSLVVSLLRDRLANLSLKIPGNVACLPLPRDAVAAVILVWLWANHETNFQDAFKKSGRIDVDPDCKWLIQTAVDTAVRELSADITDSITKGETVYADISAPKKNHAAKAVQVQGSAEIERSKPSSAQKLEIRTVSVVSKALMVKLHIDPFANKCIPNFEQAIAFLDESRVGALRAKAQERVVLANFLAKKTTVSDLFSHAYVSAMVRAGEALGHDKLFEIVQNEELLVCTMIPYDVFTDENGEWEDPCKVDTGFTPGESGEELIRRAHARAMFHKSLRKLQDRHSIRGGVSDHGPYADGSDALREANVTKASIAYTRVGLKRRHSLSEPPPPPGTGSVQAPSWAVYQPQHVSEPLEWQSHLLENKPYGRHRRGNDDRKHSFSFGGARDGSFKKAKKSDDTDNIPSADVIKVEEEVSADTIPKSTFEIKWGDLAGIFQRVELPRSRRSSSSRQLKKSESHDDNKSIKPRTIFAPFCRPITHISDLERQLTEAASEDYEEEDEEEDISDETVLAHHQLVLDEMKAKIQAYMDAKKTQKEQKRMRMSK
ncbi:hypothetical protein FisN_11Lh334 [Fistulifera solaris]|uniref:Uncharacterized protein n=1 Tax=Fistulifera solaris TaxID=1519565 RepID=A0A1Z5K132_FISSO|nr:hypothetical protein FisN_11Lh334 [Fistulifera solaris]|eukprot:GAX19806.1 hypothetical protein FisN_11Lh334 [Fistulifera solaris]